MQLYLPMDALLDELEIYSVIRLAMETDSTLADFIDSGAIPFVLVTSDIRNAPMGEWTLTLADGRLVSIHRALPSPDMTIEPNYLHTGGTHGH